MRTAFAAIAAAVIGLTVGAAATTSGATPAMPSVQLTFSDDGIVRWAPVAVPPTTTATTVATTTTVRPTTTTTSTVPPAASTTSPTTTTTPVAVDVAKYLTVPGWGASAGYPAFRFFCEFSHLAKADPIVFPGRASAGHLHQFFGNTLTSGSSTYATLRSSGDGTCQGGPLNRTGYWMPAVLDAAGRAVIPDDFEIYYKAENAPLVNGVRQVSQWPDGLRMIAGARSDGKPVDPSAGRPDGGDGLTWGWRCGTGPATSTIPSCPAGVRLVGFVRFPYCWDGKNLDSPDHRSHLRYGTVNTWGPCPTGWIHIPEVTEFIRYGAATNAPSWRLSSDAGAPAGSTFHADWFGAWEPTIQARWFACLRADRNASGGAFCDGAQLTWAPNYTGPPTVPAP